MRDEPARRVRSLRWGRARLPLARPYALSFTTLDHFDQVWVRVVDSRGGVGLGEAVALPGYGPESAEDIARSVSELCGGAEGGSSSSLLRRCSDLHADSPFAASAVATALELSRWRPLPEAVAPAPLCWGVSSDADPETLPWSLATGRAEGYSHLKLKVGRDLERDLQLVAPLLEGELGRGWRVSFDANQAWELDSAARFAAALARHASPRLLWLEQPLARDDWDGHARLCRGRAAPIVLDESIWNAADVERAAALGAAGVKLKLSKCLGIGGSLHLARRARALGLQVIFGNGVASDVGNLAELLTIGAEPGLFAVPAECNGFTRLGRPVAFAALVARGGRAEWAGAPRIRASDPTAPGGPAISTGGGACDVS